MSLLQEFEKALRALEIALNSPKTDLNRDASIHRYVSCVELAWKTSKKLMATTSTVPKTVLREIAQQSLIEDVDKWLSYIEARNLSSHTYKEDVAEKVYHAAKQFLPDAVELLQRLKSL